MKKSLCFIMTVLFALNFLSAKTKIITTIFPLYDWAREVTNSNDVELTLLLDNGVDLHSYNPTIQDIAKIAKCDVFIYVGGESDAWVNDILKSIRNKKMQAVNLMEVMGDNAKAEEIKEGMEAEEHEHEGHHHEGHHHEEYDEDEEEELDEHVWLSLRNAQVLTGAICEAICKADAKNASNYRANCAAFVKKLSALDKEYIQATENAPVKTVVFGDRFPFRYFVDDYNLDYYAAFVGCSAESEASFKTVAFLSNKIDELKLNNVFVIETSDKKIAKTIINNSKNKNRKILVLNSMQSAASKDVQKGMTYYSIMQENLAVLKEGLE